MSGVLHKATILVGLDTKDAQKALKSFMTQMRGLNVIGKELHTIFKGAGIIGAAFAISKMAVNASNFAKQMGIAADKLGMASSNLAAMKSAFEAIGGNGKNIEQVFNKIHQGMQSFKYGDGKWVSQLASFGINAFGPAGQKSDKEIFYDIMNAAQRMRQQGRSKQDVADMLQRLTGADYQLAEKMMMGASAFKAWQAQTNQETGVLNQKQLDNLSSLNKAFNTLGQTIGTLKNQFLGDLAPAIEFFTGILQAGVRVLQPILEGLNEVATVFFGDAEDWKKALQITKESLSEFGGMIKSLLIEIKPIAEVLGKVFKFFINILYTIGEAIGQAVWMIMHPVEALKMGWNEAKEKGAYMLNKHNAIMASMRGDIAEEDIEAVATGKMSLEQAKDKMPKGISDAEADANLAKAIQEGSVIIQNDIGVEVNSDANGVTEVTINANGTSSTGNESSTTLTERTMN